MTELDPVTPPAAVHQPLLRGRQPVAGLWLPSDWLTEAQRCQRVLAHWQAGSVLLRFAQGDLLRFATVQDLHCESLGGWPLRLQGQTLCSAPLTAQEIAALPGADVWLVLGAQVCALQVRDAQQVDPSQWLNVDSLALHDTFDCSAALAPPVMVLPMAARDVREVLNGQVGPASPEQLEFLKAMAERQLGGAMGGPGGQGQSGGGRSGAPLSPWVAVLMAFLLVAVLFNGSGSTGPGVQQRMGTVLNGSGSASPGSVSPGALLLLVGIVVLVLLVWLMLRLLRSGTSWNSVPMPGDEAAGAAGARGAGTQAGPGGAQAGQAGKPGEAGKAGTNGKPARSLFERAKGALRPQAWRQWLARLAIASNLSRLLGRRQAAYMQKMLDLFESGDLDEALRHAIPLGLDGQSLGQAFGSPQARDSLALGRQAGAATSSIHVGNDMESYLRRLYRQTFEKLDRAGRIDEAVFVLAELLKVRQEALDYLEKHGRYAQAAELALAWDSPADVIVRLHCLAGDWRLAVAVARRDKAFANAVVQLEKRWPDAAARLRQEWAQTLATAGDWLGAVDAIWPLAAQRPLAAQWLLTAELAGGPLGARALVKRVVLLPDTWVDCAEHMQTLRDDAQAHSERQAVVQAVLALKERPPAVLRLARVVLPALLADHARGDGQISKADMQRLVTLAADPWLQADLPNTALPSALTQPLGLAKVAISGQLPDAGALTILDAVALDEGRHLVALGEAGAVMVDNRGGMVARFAVPAERIVIAHNRQMALVLAQRDRVSRVSRLDLAKRLVQDLGMAELAHVATEFDGIAWTVASGTRLRVLDVQSGLNEVLWQVADLPGQVRSLSANANVEQVVLEDERGNMELWRYSLPWRRLLARGEDLPARLPHTALRLQNPNGGLIDITLAVDEQGRAQLGYRLQTRTFALDAVLSNAELTGEVQGVVDATWLMVCVVGHTQSHVFVVSLGDGQVRARMVWPAHAQPTMRASAGHCMVFDAQGRLWSMDSASSVAKSLTLN